MATELTKEEANKIFTEHSQYVYQTALLLTKSDSLADDITQETFIKVFQKYRTFDQAKPIKPWIYKITVNTFRNMYRQQKWLSFIGFAPERSTKEKTVESAILRSEQNEELCSEIVRLSTKSREVIVLYYYAELKLSEIASILDIPVGTCKSRINRALKDLRKQLSKKEIYFQKGRELYEES